MSSSILSWDNTDSSTGSKRRPANGLNTTNMSTTCSTSTSAPSSASSTPQHQQQQYQIFNPSPSHSSSNFSSSAAAAANPSSSIFFPNSPSHNTLSPPLYQKQLVTPLDISLRPGGCTSSSTQTVSTQTTSSSNKGLLPDPFTAASSSSARPQIHIAPPFVPPPSSSSSSSSSSQQQQQQQQTPTQMTISITPSPSSASSSSATLWQSLPPRRGAGGLLPTPNVDSMNSTSNTTTPRPVSPGRNPQQLTSQQQQQVSSSSRSSSKPQRFPLKHQGSFEGKTSYSRSNSGLSNNNNNNNSNNNNSNSIIRSVSLSAGSTPRTIEPSSPTVAKDIPITDDLLLSYCYRGQWEDLKTALMASDISPSRIGEQLPLPLALPALRGFHDVLMEMTESTGTAKGLAVDEVEKAQKMVEELNVKLAAVEGEINRKKDINNELAVKSKLVQAELTHLKENLVKQKGSNPPKANSNNNNNNNNNNCTTKLVKAREDLHRVHNIMEDWEALAGQNVLSLSKDDVCVLLCVAGLSAAIDIFMDSDVDGEALNLILASDGPEAQRFGLGRFGDRLRIAFFVQGGKVRSLTETKQIACAMWDTDAVMRWVNQTGASSRAATAFLRNGVTTGTVLYMMTESEVDLLELDPKDTRIIKTAIATQR